MTPQAYETLLVTGSSGFVGRHLLRRLREGPDGPKRTVALDLRDEGSCPGGDFVKCDLTDPSAVGAVMNEVCPDGVIHLAGVTGSDDARACFDANVLACENLLAAAAELPRPPRVLVVGSAAQYGLTAGEREVVDETRPLLGTTAYAVSKTLQEKWALLRGAAGEVPVICVRPFNIMGPGQPDSLVPAAFLQQVADVLDGRAGEVRVGNLDSQRDFTDVRDVAAAMWALMSAGRRADGQVFNIASGAAVKIADMLQACIALTGRQIAVRQDRDRRKAVDVPTIIGEASRLRNVTGWRPQVTWQQSLTDMWTEMRRPAP